MVSADLSLNTLSVQADILRALSQIILIWGDHTSAGTTFIPRSRSMEVGDILDPSSVV